MFRIPAPVAYAASWRWLVTMIVLAAVMQIAQATPTFAAVADAFAFPVGYPDGQGYNTSAGYSFLQIGVQGMHPGEDWNKNCGGDCDVNDSVVAAANGRVVAAGDYAIWGNVILIEHVLPDGTRVWTPYAHLNRILVSSGDVQRGQQIGTVGKGAGNQYPAHLHFEVRTQSLPADWWPASHGWDAATVLQYYTEPSAFVRSHRTTAVITPPTRVSPSQGAQVGGRRITFQWQAPAIGDLKGYTLRVTDQPNLDGQPWLVDTGVGKEQSQYAADLPAGSEGKQLYWGMKTLTNSGQTSAWSSAWTLTVDSPAAPATDTTPPNLESWSFDPADATGGGRVTLRASGSDSQSGVARIDFWCNLAGDGSVNGQWRALGSAINISPSASFTGETSWDVSDLAEGRYRIGIDLTDARGNKLDAGTQRGIIYTVDKTPPTGRISAPVSGAVLTGSTIAIAAEASDALSGMSAIQFFVSSPEGWQFIGADVDGADGWQLAWDASALADDATFALSIVPIDRAGNWISASVDNLTIRRDGGASTPVLGGVYAHNSHDLTQAPFQPGDQITLGITGSVEGNAPVPASLWWRVEDAQGNRVAALSFDNFRVTLDPSGWNYVLPTNIPADLAPGAYVFWGELHAGEQVQRQQVAFMVGGPPAGWATDQWQHVSSFTVDPGVAYSGGHAARIDSPTENDARWTQYVIVTPNTSYVLSGWIKTTNVGQPTIGANLGLVDGWPHSADVRSTQDWTYVEVMLDSGSRTELWIGARLGHWGNTNTGVAWFDDLALREQGSGGLGPNLLRNGGFEE